MIAPDSHINHVAVYRSDLLPHGLKWSESASFGDERRLWAILHVEHVKGKLKACYKAGSNLYCTQSPSHTRLDTSLAIQTSTMRFLCLHGMGTNSKVYEAQLAPVRQRLDPTYEFEFVDGLVECGPATGVPSLFPGPFYCYYNKPTAENLQAAYDLVLEIIEEEGPFEGIFGFSQGGALAASLLLHHRKTNPHAPELFDLAVFTCASLPFDLQTANQVKKYNTIVDPHTGEVDVRDWVEGDVVEPAEINGFITASEPGDVVLRRYHPDRESARIQIPTVHVMGELDPFLPQSKVTAGLCSRQSTIVHDQGHNLPRDARFALKVAVAIQRAISTAMFQH